MKNFILLTVIVSFLSSCGKSLENKANALIEDSVKKVLYHPESYSSVETKLDSAFSPVDDPVIINKMLELFQLSDAVTEYDDNMRKEKSDMAMWSGPMQSEYGRNEYQEAKKKYDENAEHKKNAELKAAKIGDELKSDFESYVPTGRQFIGYKAEHSYRAQNNAGQTRFGNMWFLFDKDMSKIIASYDMDSDDFKEVQAFYEVLRESIAEKENK